MRQGVEELDVAEPTASALEVRFGAMRDLAAALPAGIGLLDELFVTRRDSGAPLPARSADQQPRQLGIAGNVARFEHRQPCRDVLAGHLQASGTVRTL